MALTLLAFNNASSVLAAGISASATSLAVNTGTGTLFPSPVSGTSYFKLTLLDAATGTITEIMHVTAVSGDTFTVLRGQEGTTARIWSANDIAANMLTAGSLLSMLQINNNLSEIAAAGTAAQNAALKNLGSSDGTLNGRLINVQIFVNNGQYTPTTGTKKIIVEAISGGGGSLSGSAPSGQTGGCPPGYHGQYNKSQFDLSAISTPLTVTVGSGGTANNYGGATYFGPYMSLGGGNPADATTSSSSSSIAGRAYPITGAVNTSTGLIISSSQGETFSTQLVQVTAGVACGFSAPASPFPGGWQGRGADGTYASGAISYTGKTGNPGMLIVWEYS
ncbi:hypothetical protein J1785_22005 [Rahnella sp. SL6]|uniref:hypothetical protein n=1 Tax=Rahnella perminowiae TaxID=2816244 RepID=UPI001C273443|nr:hypothetical protein [Rahnella perminowiae]MBU9812392.1 hypothetical protein [Rahnella perminowiae]